jgi:hypothetical protein
LWQKPTGNLNRRDEANDKLVTLGELLTKKAITGQVSQALQLANSILNTEVKAGALVAMFWSRVSKRRDGRVSVAAPKEPANRLRHRSILTSREF